LFIGFFPSVGFGFGLTVGLHVQFLHGENLPHPEISISTSADISLSVGVLQDEAG
jgi:hypothetical protein